VDERDEACVQWKIVPPVVEIGREDQRRRCIRAGPDRRS
jgi:hypothetical protein